MLLFRRNKTPDCAHTWYLADFEVGSFNAGVSVEIEDYFVLRCEKCNSKRKVDEYEFEKLQTHGLVKEGAK